MFEEVTLPQRDSSVITLGHGYFLVAGLFWPTEVGMTDEKGEKEKAGIIMFST